MYGLCARNSIGVFEGRGVGGLGPTLVSCPCASAEWSRYNSPLCSMLPVLKLSFCIWTLELTLKIICCWYEFTTIAQNTLIHDHYCGNNATHGLFLIVKSNLFKMLFHKYFFVSFVIYCVSLSSSVSGNLVSSLLVASISLSRYSPLSCAAPGYHLEWATSIPSRQKESLRMCCKRCKSLSQ